MSISECCAAVTFPMPSLEKLHERVTCWESRKAETHVCAPFRDSLETITIKIQWVSGEAHLRLGKTWCGLSQLCVQQQWQI